MQHLSDNELINYISGKLSDDWNKQIEHHLATCSECHETATFLQDMNEEWEIPSNYTLVNFTDQVMSKIQAVTPLQENNASPTVVELKKAKPNKNLKYLHFGLAAAAMILFSQVGLGDIVTKKSVEYVSSSTKKMNQATATFTKGVQSVNKLTKKQINKMEDLKHEKTK